MNFISPIPYIPAFASGILITLELVACALTLGFLASLLTTFCIISRYRYLRWPAASFVFVIRGTPLLVQFFIIYFGLSQFELLRNSALWIILVKPFNCAVIALALNTCAYTTILFRGGIRSVPHGEVEACQALGMSRWIMLRRIIFPRAFRMVLPAYSNEVLMILKGTSLASTITLLDLMGVTRQIIAENYAAIEFLLIAGVIYFCLNAVIIAAFKYAERRFHRYLLN